MSYGNRDISGISNADNSNDSMDISNTTYDLTDDGTGKSTTVKNSEVHNE